ncbi:MULTISPECIES: PEP-CTERM sorting domain-containing protein [unclassified Massilia]|uniref:PEP-CTERM sorting domain-containing protein n=1 Tax=unclassified Massilia TaxID=2609279 RepID=UPI001784A100|nr:MULTISPECIES: PEP-CTERM sorting domain-containing protein [unclassified Massilia]MBD8530717.1 PEP-CTERM sorting domain-containing protein [Massilia sp. CFBP 13647]MBD8676443.1 PEP-CTERM sorting domain-containing protein [Massilia sp. CFBP 13721]
MKNIIIALTSAICLLCTATAQAGIILQDKENISLQVNAFEPLGQSFIAEDQKIKFAFYYKDFNPDTPLETLRMRLLSGDGPSGIVLGSVEFSLIAAFEGFFDVDFSGITLTVGSTYTALLDVPGNSPRWGVSAHKGDVYLNGSSYELLGNLTAQDDMRFRVTPALETVPGEVPEPASIAIFALGLAGLHIGRRKTK